VTLFLQTKLIDSVTQVFAEPGTAIPATTFRETLTSDGYRLQHVMRVAGRQILDDMPPQPSDNALGPVSAAGQRPSAEL
jgi:hypothetical protein